MPSRCGNQRRLTVSAGRVDVRRARSAVRHTRVSERGQQISSSGRVRAVGGGGDSRDAESFLRCRSGAPRAPLRATGGGGGAQRRRRAPPAREAACDDRRCWGRRRLVADGRRALGRCWTCRGGEEDLWHLGLRLRLDDHAAAQEEDGSFSLTVLNAVGGACWAWMSMSTSSSAATSPGRRRGSRATPSWKGRA